MDTQATPGVLRIPCGTTDGVCLVRAQGPTTDPRQLVVRSQGQEDAIQMARQRPQTPAFRERQATGAGGDGTISQGVRVCDLRRSRCMGLTKPMCSMS